MAYQCKGLDQCHIVCQYEVNLSTNEKDEKVITKKQNYIKVTEGQGHDATCCV